MRIARATVVVNGVFSSQTLLGANLGILDWVRFAIFDVRAGRAPVVRAAQIERPDRESVVDLAETFGFVLLFFMSALLCKVIRWNAGLVSAFDD